MGRPALYPTDPKPCAVCGIVFSRNPNERPAEFFKRKTCGVPCGLVLTARSATQRRVEFAPKFCATCGQLLARNPHERPSDYRTRKTCGWGACRGALISRALKAVTDERMCAVCGSAFSQREDETSYAFSHRKTCGPDCRAALISRSWRNRRLPIPDRYCLTCGALLVQANTEAMWTFKHRQTCDHKCGAQLAKRTMWRHWGHSSPYPPEWTRHFCAAIRERDGHSCRLCGAFPGKRAHHIHHIDSVKANLDPTNLITLCPACHAKVTKGDRAHWHAVLTALVQEQSP